MKCRIDSPEQLGSVIRASRKAMKLRQDDAAGSIGVSENFLGKVERGGESVQWGKLFLVLQELGLTVTVDVPNAYAKDARKQLDKLALKLVYEDTDAPAPSDESPR